MNFLKNKTVLITGGTGTFGKEGAKFILKNIKVKKLIILSEMKTNNTKCPKII